MSEATSACSSSNNGNTATWVVVPGSNVDVFIAWATDKDNVSYCTSDFQASIDQAKNKDIPYPCLHVVYDNYTEGRVIGLIFVKKNSGNYDYCTAEVSYCLDKEYLRKERVAENALKLVIPIIFREMPDLERLEAKVEVNDWDSRRTLEGAGFQREGVLRKYGLLEGRTVDVAMYSFLSSDLHVGLSFA